MNKWINIIQDSLLPPSCILCHQAGYNRWDICYDCYNTLPWIKQACPRCGLPLASEGIDSCGECLKQPPSIDNTLAVFQHQGSIRYLIGQLKFQAKIHHARLLGQLLAEAALVKGDLPEAIIAIPLHPKRFQERGFNQSLEIARTLSKQLQIPLLLDSCSRHRDTSHQTELRRSERKSNVKNCFSVQKTIPHSHVALIDDVTTTGATLNELAMTLKQSGVKRVDAWVCAHA